MLRNQPNHEADSIVFATASNLPIDSARYYDDSMKEVVIVFSDKFFNLDDKVTQKKTREWVGEIYDKAQEAALHVRCERIMHELAHDNEIRSRKEEIEEETNIIMYLDISLWKITESIGVLPEIYELRTAYPGVKKAMHYSGEFFNRIPRWIEEKDLKYRRRAIRSYVREVMPVAQGAKTFASKKKVNKNIAKRRQKKEKAREKAKQRFKSQDRASRRNSDVGTDTDVERYRAIVEKAVREDKVFVSSTLRRAGIKDVDRFVSSKKIEVEYLAESGFSRICRVALYSGEEKVEFAIALGRKSREKEISDIATADPRKDQDIISKIFSIKQEFRNLQRMHKALPENVVEPFAYTEVGDETSVKFPLYSMKFFPGFEGTYIIFSDGKYRVTNQSDSDILWQMVDKDFQGFLKETFKIQIRLFHKLQNKFCIFMQLGDFMYPSQSDAKPTGGAYRYESGVSFKTVPFDRTKPVILTCARPDTMRQKGFASWVRTHIFRKKLIRERRAALVASFLNREQVSNAQQVEGQPGYFTLPYQDAVPMLVEAMEEVFPEKGKRMAIEWFIDYLNYYGRFQPREKLEFIDNFLDGLAEETGYSQKPGNAPTGMIGWVWGWLAKHRLISMNEAARVAPVWEEMFFSVFLLNVMPWFLSKFGFVDPVLTIALFLASNILFGLSHNKIYRWDSEGGITSPTKATFGHRMGFMLLGASFRIGYIIPGLGPLWSAVNAFTLHGLYNNFLAKSWKSPIAMTAQKKIDKIIHTRGGFLVTGRAFLLSGLGLVAAFSALVISIVGPGILSVGIGISTLILILAIARKIEIIRLDYYLKHVCDILDSVKDAKTSDKVKLEKKQVHKLFKHVINVYKSYFLRDFVQKRKILLAYIILFNIISPEEVERIKRDEAGVKPSIIRSNEAITLVINEIFKSGKRGVYEPALETIIEILAKEEKSHGTFFFKRLFPLLEESERLPRFAKALIEEVAKAKRGEVITYEIHDESAFFEETKRIIVQLSERSPELKKKIIEELLKSAGKYNIVISKKNHKGKMSFEEEILDRLNFHIVNSMDFTDVCAAKLGDKIRALQNKKTDGQDINIVFATGNTMVETLDKLALEDGIDWSRVQAFHLDEYKGLSEESPYSFAHYLEKNIFSKVPIPRENIHYIGGEPDPRGYIKKLNDLGGADIAILGIGPNGHIAFNEPGTLFDESEGVLRKVRFAKATIEANRPDYPAIDENPMAYTMSIADILNARHIFFFAKGSKKAKMIRKTVRGSESRRLPATALQRHPNVTYVLDGGASRLVAPDALTEKHVDPKSTKSIFILDDRPEVLGEVIEYVRKHCPNIERIVTAEDLDKAKDAIEKEEPFDLVVSDLCISNITAESFKYVDFAGKKVQLRRGGEAFVTWLKNHQKCPQEIILHSTMFNRFSFDSFLALATGYKPRAAKDRMREIGVIAQPKTIMIKPHKRSAKTLIKITGWTLGAYIFGGLLVPEMFISIPAGIVFAALMLSIGIRTRQAIKREKIEKGNKEYDEINSITVENQTRDVTYDDIDDEEDGNYILEAEESYILDDLYSEAKITLQGEGYMSSRYKGTVDERDAIAGNIRSYADLAGLDDRDQENLSVSVSWLLSKVQDGPAGVFVRKVSESNVPGVEVVVREFGYGINNIEIEVEGENDTLTVEMNSERIVYGHDGVIEHTVSSINRGVRITAVRFKSEEAGEDPEAGTASGAPGISHMEFNSRTRKMLSKGNGTTVFATGGVVSPNNKDARKDEAYDELREMLLWDLPAFANVPLVESTQEGMKRKHSMRLDTQKILNGEAILTLHSPREVEVALVDNPEYEKGPLYWNGKKSKGAIIQVAHAGRGAEKDEDRLVLYLDKNFVDDHLNDLKVVGQLVAEEIAEEFVRRNGYDSRYVHNHLIESGQIKDLYDEYRKYYGYILGRNPNFLHGKLDHAIGAPFQNIASGTVAESSTYGPYRVDDKLRVTVPSELRKRLEGQKLILETLVNGDIVVWHEEEVARIVRGLDIRMSDAALNDWARKKGSSCAHARIDGSGRIKISNHLERYIEIPKEYLVEDDGKNFVLKPIYVSGEKVLDIPFGVKYVLPGATEREDLERINALWESMSAIHAEVERNLKNMNSLTDEQISDVIQILQHLIPNAVDAAYEGMDKGELRPDEKDVIRFQLFHDQEKGIFTFVLTDRGRGIEESVMKNIVDGIYPYSTKTSSSVPRYVGKNGEGIEIVLDSAWRNDFDVRFTSKRRGQDSYAFTQDKAKRREIRRAHMEHSGTKIMLTKEKKAAEADTSPKPAESISEAETVVSKVIAETVKSVNVEDARGLGSREEARETIQSILDEAYQSSQALQALFGMYKEELTPVKGAYLWAYIADVVAGIEKARVKMRVAANRLGMSEEEITEFVLSFEKSINNIDVVYDEIGNFLNEVDPQNFETLQALYKLERDEITLEAAKRRTIILRKVTQAFMKRGITIGEAENIIQGSSILDDLEAEVLKQEDPDHPKKLIRAARMLDNELLSAKVADVSKHIQAKRAEDITRNAKRVVPHLTHALMRGVTRAEEGKIAILLDMPPVESANVKAMIKKCIIKPLKRMNKNNEDIEEILENLIVYDRYNMNVLKDRMDRGVIKGKNVIIMTSKDRKDAFDDFGGAYINALNFSSIDTLTKMEGSYYYPYLETTFFAVIRALGANDLGTSEKQVKKYRERLWRWYKEIPNVAPLTYEQLMGKCFHENGSVQRSVTLDLIPNATVFSYSELRKIYERIEEFITKA